MFQISSHSQSRLIRILLKFLKFALVGASGTVVNMAVFSVFYGFFYTPPWGASLAGFTIAVTFNYIINALWTFRAQTGIYSFITYFFGNTGGLVINLVVLQAVLFQAGHLPAAGYIAQAAGIAAGMVFNFLAASFIFRKESTQKSSQIPG